MKKLLATFAILIALGAVNAMAASDANSADNTNVAAITVTCPAWISIDVVDVVIPAASFSPGSGTDAGKMVATQAFPVVYSSNSEATVAFTNTSAEAVSSYITTMPVGFSIGSDSGDEVMGYNVTLQRSITVKIPFAAGTAPSGMEITAEISI